MNKCLPLWSGVVLASWNYDQAHAVEIALIAPGGIRAAVQQMIPAFEKATGHKVTATFGSGGGTKQRVIQGEPFDVPIVQLPLEPVIASGHVVAASETALAHVSVGVAVRAGAPKPDISSADSVKRLLLGAKAIAYPNAATGAAAGASFNRTLEKLGIAEAMKPKIRIARGGRGAMELLAKGEVDIGLTFISEIITEAGVEVVGPLPRDISTPTTLIGFVSTQTNEPDAATALLRYLSSPEAAEVYKQRGMEPDLTLKARSLTLSVGGEPVEACERFGVLPSLRAGRAFPGTDDLIGYPTAVEKTGLRADMLVIDKALDAPGVKRKVTRDLLIRNPRSRIIPGNGIAQRRLVF
jgi:molybdate transport system substrate-binding protein